MSGSKSTKTSQYNIMIFSASDARKKPISLSLQKNTAVVIFAGIFWAVTIVAFFMHAFAARSVSYSNQIAQLKKTIDEQSEQILIKSDAIASLEQAVQVTNVEDDEDNPEGFIQTAAITNSVGTNGMRNGKIELLDWFQGGSELYARYTSVTVVDVETGLRFNVRRTGGHFHADSEPLTKEDTETMHEIYGGHWTWNRRAIVLIIGDRYIAASMNGMPHVNDPSQSNGFPGHFCIHFLHSRGHASGKECPVHQSMVMYAFENGNSVLN